MTDARYKPRLYLMRERDEALQMLREFTEVVASWDTKVKKQYSNDENERPTDFDMDRAWNSIWDKFRKCQSYLAKVGKS